MNARYTEKQLDFLRAYYPKLSVVDLTNAFNLEFSQDKTPGQIKSTLTNHGIKCGRKTGESNKGISKLFNVTEREWIVNHYTHLTLIQIAQAFIYLFNPEEQRVN